MECLGNIRAREREREQASFVQNGVVVRARTRHKTRRTIDLCFFYLFWKIFYLYSFQKGEKEEKPLSGRDSYSLRSRLLGLFTAPL